jgi:hypothetical protein
MATTVATLTATSAFAQKIVSSIAYATPNLGGMVIDTSGGVDATVGYARVQPTASTVPASEAILDFTQNGVLVSETGLPGVTAIPSGRTYAEVNGAINTGIAFANTSIAPIDISFTFTDQVGNSFGQTSFRLGPNAQLARFINEAPFALRTTFTGTFTFNASAPVAVLALRTFVNERNEFLAVAQPIAALPSNVSTGALLFGHFADGGGWSTQVLLVNTTDTPISGTVQFLGEGNGVVVAVPVTITVNGQIGTTFNYTVPARASLRFATVGPVSGLIQMGTVRITPAGADSAPSAFLILSLFKNGVTVSQTTVQTQPTGTAFRSYVEINSKAVAVGVIQSAVAVANNSITPATVNFELTDLTGANTGLVASVNVPPFGHVAKFIQELFPTIPLPTEGSFRGVLRVTSFSSIEVVSLRTRHNERGDLLTVSVPVANEAAPSSNMEQVFPQFVNGGGNATQFIFFSGVYGQSTTGTLGFFGQNGQPVNVTVR